MFGREIAARKIAARETCLFPRPFYFFRHFPFCVVIGGPFVFERTERPFMLPAFENDARCLVPAKKLAPLERLQLDSGAIWRRECRNLNFKTLLRRQLVNSTLTN